MMNNELRPYDEYSETGINWIENIPSTWKIVKNSVLFREIVDTGHSELELLSILQNKGIVKQSSTGRKIRKAEENQSYKRICKGDIGYNLMNAFMGAIGASKYEGIISPAYAVCRPKIDINVWYYHYLFRTEMYKSEFNKNSYGIMYERNRLYFDRFKNINAIFPPRREQDQIVKYLDYKLAKINKFIKAKKKLISALKEQKQAVINEAVTKGLNPNVKMKPSGIEWLGEVPEHWEVTAVKYFAKSNLYTLTESTEDTEIYYLEIGSVGFGELKSEPEKYMFKEAPSRARRIVNEGDTIVSTVRTYLKSMLYIDKELKGCIVSTGFCVLTPLKNVFPKLLSYVLTSNYFISMVSQNSVGISYPSISESKLMKLKIAIPESIPEQEEILDYIVDKTQEIDKAICILQKEIALMTEYKTTLISDVVTGKIDVRHIEIDELEKEATEETDFDDISLDEDTGEAEESED